MEKIIQHYAGNISMDMESLRVLAESVDKAPEAIRNHRPAPLIDSPGSDYLGVDDENFTVQPLDNNTTREHSPLTRLHSHSTDSPRIDYSGEFSHWNFSMRIKQWIEQCVPEPGRLVSCDSWY